MSLRSLLVAPARLRITHYGLLAMMCLVLFSPGRGWLPPIDRDESRYRRTAPVRFLLAWIIPSWIVFEAVVIKLMRWTP